MSSAPLPELWKKMGNADRVGCSSDGDLLFQLMPGEQADLSHDIARVGANGAALGYFDLRRTPGFEKATIQQATFDSAGRIVLLVRNLTAVETTSTDAEGHPRGTRFRMDHTLWVLTVDNNGKILSKFSFNDRVISGQRFALFKNGNVLVTGFSGQVKHGVPVGTSGVIFSPDGAVLANLKLPAPEDQESAASMERSPAPTVTPVRATGSTSGGDAEAAGVRHRPSVLVPMANGEEEIFLLHMGDAPFLQKVSADGTVGPNVKLAVPADELMYVERIAGHRVLAAIYPAEKLPPGTITKAPEWKPKAVFDTESGALVETMLVSMYEEPVCYSGSGMKAIRVPEGMLDTLEK
ncbi:MAG: hypothetical protein ACJ71Q_20265 [Terriglobales bacterium]